MTARFARLLTCALTVGVGALVCTAQATAAAPAQDPTARAEELGAQARDAYRATRYDRAIELYLEAYETAASAGFLFNIAFIYDTKTGDKALARDYYERAASFAGADPELVAKARARAGELAAALARPPDPPPDPDKGPDKDPDKGPDKDPDKGPDKGPGDVVEDGSGILPWVVMGSGAAVLATGIVMGVVAAGTESDFQAATDNDSRRSLQATGTEQALVADVLLVLGIGAVGTGLVLWLLDDRDGGERGTIHITPAMIEGGAGVVVGGSL